MRKFSTNKLCILALCSVINLIGGQIALLLRLPIYLDSFGTVFAAAVMGPFYGMIPGIVSNLIGGVTTDIYALYYLPVQMITGCMAGFVFRKMPPHDGKDLGKILFGSRNDQYSGNAGQLFYYCNRIRWNHLVRIYTSGAAVPSSWSGADCKCMHGSGIDRLCRQSDRSGTDSRTSGTASFFR